MGQRDDPEVGRRSSVSLIQTAAHGFQETDARGQQRPATASADKQELVTDKEVDSRESQRPGPGCTPTTSTENSPSIPPTHPMSLSTPTERSILHVVYHFLETLDPGGVDTSLCFERAAIQPPITPESLAELDMSRIINNPKLRHDVNFDNELHFRPNLDGSKGRQKMKSAEEYWRALEGEFFMYNLVQQQRAQSFQKQNEAYWERLMKASQKRLPKVFEVVRDILKTLVPDSDQQQVIDRLDVDLLMQEIHNGVCDLIDLGNWFAKVLKNHCAPMRDVLVDRMQQAIHRGTATRDHSLMVSGLRQLLGILEAMKLDVANHQIRHMRPLLIEDTINFQRRYNAHRISLGKIKIATPRLWLQHEFEHLIITGYDPTYLDALSSALLRDLVFARSKSGFPTTFYLDSDRLLALRVDLHSIVYQRICSDVLVEVACSRVPRDKLAQGLDTLHTSLSAIIGIQGRYADKVDNVAVEIVRIVLTLEGRSQTYDACLMEIAEQKLASELRTTSPSFIAHAHKLSQNLIPELQRSVHAKSRLSALELQEALLPSVPTPHAQAFGFGAVCQPISLQQPQSDSETEIIHRLTHVLLLHWQIWADLAYLTPPEPEAEIGVDEYTPPSSGAVSPTVPVAQAVYRPEGKRLPTAVAVTDRPSGMPTPAASPVSENERRENGNEAGEAQGEQSPLAAPPSPG